MKQIRTSMRYGLWCAVLYRNGKPIRYGAPAASCALAMRNLLA